MCPLVRKTRFINNSLIDKLGLAHKFGQIITLQVQNSYMCVRISVRKLRFLVEPEIINALTLIENGF